ncbi:helix-turn-helix domain-containing protein [Actinomadura chibensis]|uniref:Helix-turn-helix transcriptional regulator n=1 Tax=Actinomadura chibensis TaxID=392828 RepID=A0A5D0P051_9ACTN|nr:helix-turn-helix transcriptional regulator [Actinomadura chibensis]TYB49719.1 helix-turn-helix transcriptional regulator [Actinomadura chibensis]
MADSEQRTPLGEFLRSRRAALKPGDVGVVSYGARRVPGLRREELAQLAGVSATYYARLEQGHSANASPTVIDALARALGLDADERAHLHDLARPAPGRRRRPSRPAAARPGTRQLIGALGDVPAVVLGRRTEVLAWNTLGHLLLAGHYAAGAPDRPAERPNLTRMLFLDAHYRDLHVHWQEEATRAIASLRLVAGRFPDDRDLAELVGELSMRSPEFASLWSKHPVATCASGTKHFRHPEVGELTLQFEALHLPDDSGHRILMYSAAPGSPSEAALRLLRAKVAEPSQPARRAHAG